ncbi:NAD(P)/FAD-dependent oxidoreductase, partial [candidate division KSB1 bacterium]|nr:NAD(P)/FAD-dependent oxidoreductase [candidate division KSB1 bacterium]
MTRESRTEKNQLFDAIIIGAGPAGLMAAIASHQPGRKICILEKMPLPALKLKISGKGRCNITNAAERRDFLSHFGPNSRFLKPAFANFFNTDLISFFESLGIRFKLERGGRWFPQSDDAHEIVRALFGHIRNLGITLQTHSAVADILPLPDGELQVTVSDSSRKTGVPETKILIGKRVVL